ncbi:MAG: FixH family protein [Rhodocyclaceae bacterium]|nr:FixH family protein [Rhodocyclaceae bacterium]
MTMTLNTKPWYREPWPWLLMSGPFIVVVASFITAWIAWKSNDGLVADDYYKQGLAAGQTVARSQQAQILGLQAGVSFLEGTLQVRLSSQTGAALPESLTVMLSHPTRAGLDQELTLIRAGLLYSGAVRPPASGHWLILIEDEAKTWRLMGAVVLPATGESVIGG